jgi:hypothetical protein
MSSGIRLEPSVSFPDAARMSEVLLSERSALPNYEKKGITQTIVRLATQRLFGKNISLQDLHKANDFIIEDIQTQKDRVLGIDLLDLHNLDDVSDVFWRQLSSDLREAVLACAVRV